MAQRPLIYICYYLQGNDTPDNRRVACLATASSQIRDFLADAITTKQVVYETPKGCSASPYMQRYQFLRDWETVVPAMRKKVINSRLKGAMLDTALGGREYDPERNS